MALVQNPGKVQSDEAPVDDEISKARLGATACDYSGARTKSDPREIALVRKLDWWIMPILWFMYFLNYLVRTALLNMLISHDSY